MKDVSTNVKTISMINNKLRKKITPIKIILDADNEIRATNFHGTSRTGKPYVVPQLVFVKATGKQKSVDISFSFDQIDQIITSLNKVREENDRYFDQEDKNPTIF